MLHAPIDLLLKTKELIVKLGHVEDVSKRELNCTKSLEANSRPSDLESTRNVVRCSKGVTLEI